MCLFSSLLVRHNGCVPPWGLPAKFLHWIRSAWGAITCSNTTSPLWCFHTRARQRQDNDKTNVEPVYSYYAFHTRSDKPGVKGIIGIHRFNICLVVVLLWCENTITPVVIPMFLIGSERQIQSQYQIWTLFKTHIDWRSVNTFRIRHTRLFVVVICLCVFVLTFFYIITRIKRCEDCTCSNFEYGLRCQHSSGHSSWRTLTAPPPEEFLDPPLNRA